MPGSAIVDVALVGVDVIGRLTVTVDARNLLDSRYYLPASSGATNFVKNPQDTRQLMAQASYAF